MKKLIIMILVFGVPFFSQGQTAIEVMHKISDTYNNSLSDFDAFIRYFDDVNSTNVVDSMQVHSCMKGADFYYKLGDQVEMLNTGSYFIQVNYEEHEIYVTGRQAGNSTMYGWKMIDTLIKTGYGTYTLETDASGLSYIEVKVKSPTVPEMKIYYDPKSFEIKEIVFYYLEEKQLDEDVAHETKVELIYQKQDIRNRDFSSAGFNISDFITQSGTQITPASRFNGFKVINDYNQELKIKN